MADIRYITGDLVGLPIDYVVHQQNCFGAWDAGIANNLSESYVGLLTYENNKLSSYLLENSRGSYLGKLSYFETQNIITCEPLTICSSYTQYVPIVGLGVTHVEELVGNIKKVCERANMDRKTVGIPLKIGSGLATGNTDEILSKIEEAIKDIDVTLYIVSYEERKYFL